MDNYKTAIALVLKHEGGYVKDPIDRGGETFRGISRRFFPSWEGWGILDTEGHFDERLDDMVENFYKVYFWDALNLSLVEDDFVASMLLNVSVNQGKKSVTKKIQRILNVKVDGNIGKLTLSALNSHNRDAFVYQFIIETVDLYTHIIKRDRTQKKFIVGWLSRAMFLYSDYEYYKNFLR